MELGYVLLDGCADRPNPRLNYTTPLEAASTPNLDSIAAHSRLGEVVTVGRGIAPESDIAVFNMLGYSFTSGYPGRGVIEAVGAGLRFRMGDLALRANLATADGRRIVDRRAGRDLTDEEGRSLEKVLNEIKLDGAELEFRTTVGYRGVLVIRGNKPLSGEVSNTDPAYAKIGGFGAAKDTTALDRVERCRPLVHDDGATKAADLINEFSDKALIALGRSDVNRERAKSGRMPANCVLLRDAGDHLPAVQSFEESYNMKGTALVEMPAEVGIAKILKMRMVRVGDRNDLERKARLFRKEMSSETVVYAHLKGPDEFGHDGDAVGKKKSIEKIDSDFFSVAVGLLEGATIAVSCDHATPCTLKKHSSDPVPLLVSTKKKSDGFRFTEPNAKRGSLGRLNGRDVLRRALGRV